MKLWKKILIGAVLIVAVALVIYPNIVIDTGDRLLVYNYPGDFLQIRWQIRRNVHIPCR